MLVVGGGGGRWDGSGLGGGEMDGGLGWGVCGGVVRWLEGGRSGGGGGG